MNQLLVPVLVHLEGQDWLSGGSHAAQHDAVFLVFLLQHGEKFGAEIVLAQAVVRGHDHVRGSCLAVVTATARVPETAHRVARGEQRLQNALVDEKGFARGNPVLVHFTGSGERLAIQLREGGIVGDAEEIRQHTPANFIEEGILRLCIAHAQRRVHHGPAHAQQVGKENHPEELRCRIALCQNRAVVALHRWRRSQILEALAKCADTFRQCVNVGQPIERLRVKRRRILQRNAVCGLGVCMGVEGYAGLLARVPCAFAVHVAHRGIYRGKTDAGGVNVRRGTEKRREVARLGLPLCAIHVNGRSRDGGLRGSFLCEVGNPVGVEFVLESRALFREVLDGFLVSGVGDEPDLPP